MLWPHSGSPRVTYRGEHLRVATTCSYNIVKLVSRLSEPCPIFPWRRCFRLTCTTLLLGALTAPAERSCWCRSPGTKPRRREGRGSNVGARGRSEAGTRGSPRTQDPGARSRRLRSRSPTPVLLRRPSTREVRWVAETITETVEAAWLEGEMAVVRSRIDSSIAYAGQEPSRLVASGRSRDFAPFRHSRQNRRRARGRSGSWILHIDLIRWRRATLPER